MRTGPSRPRWSASRNDPAPAPRCDTQTSARPRCGTEQSHGESASTRRLFASECGQRTLRRSIPRLTLYSPSNVEPRRECRSGSEQILDRFSNVRSAHLLAPDEGGASSGAAAFLRLVRIVRRRRTKADRFKPSSCASPSRLSLSSSVNRTVKRTMRFPLASSDTNDRSGRRPPSSVTVLVRSTVFVRL